ncbi:hypothetical protein PTI98_005706 [Pleurotus ostreatus]|nr:hypothetical protein PTI98_005706 [Pleurotus ostreatus]
MEYRETCASSFAHVQDKGQILQLVVAFGRGKKSIARPRLTHLHQDFTVATVFLDSPGAPEQYLCVDVIYLVNPARSFGLLALCWFFLYTPGWPESSGTANGPQNEDTILRRLTLIFFSRVY